MEKIYVISAEYGQWDDHTSVEMYVATSLDSAQNHLKALAKQFEAAYTHMIEGMCHGIDPSLSINTFTGNEHVASVALRSEWDGGVSLLMCSMPVGKTFSGGAEIVATVGVSFYPEGWDKDRIAREGEELIATEYELMAEPHEQKYGVSG